MPVTTDPIDQIAADVAAQRQTLAETDDVPSVGTSAPEPVPAPVPEADPTPAASTEIVPHDDTPTVVDIPLIPGRDEFVSLAMQAKMFASSNLVPKDLRGKPSDVLLVLMTGRDLGITPTAALRKCYVLDGQVTIAPALKIALVKTKGMGVVRPPGRFLPGVVDADGQAVPDPDFPNSRERATAIALDHTGTEIGRFTLTWDDVKDVTYDKAGKLKLVEKDNWRNYPARMLWWRAATYAVDDWFPEVAFGLYDADSLGAIVGEDGQVIDVDSVEVPAGFVRERRHAAPDTISDDEAVAMRGRAGALPQGGKDALRVMCQDRNQHLRFSSFTAGHARIVAAMLDGIEARARNGEWGPWDTPDGPDGGVEDAVLVCDNCNEGPCVCDAAAEAMDAAPSAPTAVMDDAKFETLIQMDLDTLAAMPIDDLRAACWKASQDIDDDLDGRDLAMILLDATAAFG